jgi:hypothetical protein
MHVLVYGSFYPLIFAMDHSESIALATERKLPNDDIHDVPKQTEDLLTTEVYIWLYRFDIQRTVHRDIFL